MTKEKTYMSREIMTMKQSWKRIKQVNLILDCESVFSTLAERSRDRYSCKFYDQFANLVLSMILVERSSGNLHRIIHFRKVESFILL
jgi:hypothetical protein